jgi:hypothetical protein
MKDNLIQRMLQSLGFANAAPQFTDPDPVLGVQAEFVTGKASVDQAILPGRSGRVWWQASCWPARCPHPIHLEPGTKVKILGRTNITLLVEPLDWPSCKLSLPSHFEPSYPLQPALAALMELRS